VLELTGPENVHADLAGALRALGAEAPRGRD
jgi:hypothetical protein